MNTQTADYTNLLQEAVKQSKANAPRAVDDIFHCFAKAAEAVASVTNALAVLELVPIDESESPNIYQLQLRKVGSESPPSDLGVYKVSKGGYPVLRWYSRSRQESRMNLFGARNEQTTSSTTTTSTTTRLDLSDAGDEQFPSIAELEGHFKWLVSDPRSRLVILVTFFQQ